MKNFLIAFLVFLVWSFFGLWLYSWLQPDEPGAVNKTEVAIGNDEELPDNTKVDSPTIITENPVIDEVDSLSISEAYKEEFISPPSQGLKAKGDSGDIIFMYNEGFLIQKNSPEVTIPKDLVDFKYKLNTYAVEHPETELHITSQYSPSENIDSPNLGIKRGRAVKEILVNMGIPTERIVIKPFITQIPFEEDNSFKHSFEFAFKPINEDRIQALKKSIPETKTVYPKFSYQGIMVNEELIALQQDVSEIIKENPNLHLEVIGHTDNVGNAIDNYGKGLEYARQLRWFLVTKAGIDRNKITAVSKGESEPIAGNGTVKGRNLNRRLEVKFYLDAND
ncbi:OmpA family protein [Aureitalea sp. L0-47]|uniref:OmpA family protein n=1 Tax=Aureitalea sp. L0-47 TaxID=2816962 RepID=UPI00223910C2|nr:OmpA family protein [Aureitalea sp. L0-47]MCW5519495.1 OmpA family protein [Aureitalea sp. L0-47]